MKNSILTVFLGMKNKISKIKIISMLIHLSPLAEDSFSDKCLSGLLTIMISSAMETVMIC